MNLNNDLYKLQESEDYLITALILNEKEQNRYKNHLTSEDFNHPINKELFKQLNFFWTQNISPDFALIMTTIYKQKPNFLKFGWKFVDVFDYILSMRDWLLPIEYASEKINSYYKTLKLKNKVKSLLKENKNLEQRLINGDVYLYDAIKNNLSKIEDILSYDESNQEYFFTDDLISIV